MSGRSTPCTKALDTAKLAYRLLEYDYDPDADAIGMQAAEAMGVSPDLVFKTLVCEAEGGELLCAVIPSPARLNLKALAAAAKVKKVDLAPVPKAEKSSGYVKGGISPLGQRKRLRTFLDDSCQAHAEIIVNGGRRGLQAALHPADLQQATGAVIAKITV